MTEVSSAVESVSKQVPWIKGKIVGAKPPLRPKHVWSTQTKLQVEGRLRDLVLFNVAIRLTRALGHALPFRRWAPRPLRPGYVPSCCSTMSAAAGYFRTRASQQWEILFDHLIGAAE